MHPRSEWVTHVDESLRIVSEDLWARAQRRVQPEKDGKRIKTGGKPTPDEIQAAIERAEAKAQELQSLDARTAPALKVFTMLPRAAEAYRRPISLGLEGEPRATLKTRSILRDLFGGKIRLVPEPDGGLTAHWNLHREALLKGLGTYGSGGRI